MFVLRDDVTLLLVHHGIARFFFFRISAGLTRLVYDDTDGNRLLGRGFIRVVFRIFSLADGFLVNYLNLKTTIQLESCNSMKMKTILT